MNNSKLAMDSSTLTDQPVDITPILREREGELQKIILAIKGVTASKDWEVLKEKVFDSLPATLSRQIQSEGRKETPDTLKLNRLAGQLLWAEKYSDLNKLEQVFRTELNNVKLKLYGKTQKD